MRPLYKCAWMLLNLILKMFFGIQIHGREMVPRGGPVIVASNHISLVDPPVVGAAIPREMYFLGKKELFTNRFLGAIVRAYNTVPVNRGRPDRAALRRIAELLENGEAVLLFPEGTRGSGDTLLEGKPGLGKLAAEAKVAIVPAYVRGSNCLRKSFLRKKRLSVSFGAPIARHWIEAQGRDKAAYHRIVKEVMSRIKELKLSLEN